MNNITVDGYQVFEEIGRGGSGVVYRAAELDTEREVAIKVNEQRQTTDPDFIRRFGTEAQFIAQLEHPHIVPLYTYHRKPGQVCLIMRYLRGRSLRDWLAQHGPLGLPRASQFMDQIGSALVYAHKRNIVHRDIKPSNILLDEDGNFYLADFGIAIHIRGVEIGSVSTPGYAAPEQWHGEAPSLLSDIYSLGVTLYEVLAGNNPLRSVTPDTLISHDALPRILNLPDSLYAVIERATAPDAKTRYPDVMSLALDFQQAISSHGSVTVSVPETRVPVENPYKGLNAFRETDAVDFFGREKFVSQLIARLRDGSRFLALVGASGSGKSSLVQAGLFPSLRSDGPGEVPALFLTAMTPGANPFRELESALRDVAVDSTAGLADQMYQDGQYLRKFVELAITKNGSELLLFVDQFEELFTLVDNEEVRSRFLENLASATQHPRFRLIIALRADFYDRPLNYPAFADLIRYHTEVVVPLSSEEIKEAIVKPAQRVNLSIDDGLVEAITRDVGSQPGSLPLLQYTLSDLYNRRTSNRLTLDLYVASSGLSGVLTHSADEIYGQLTPTQQEIARQVFLRLAVFDTGVEATRQRVKRSELTALMLRSEKAANWDKGQINFVLDHFNKHRLLTFDYEPISYSPTVEIAHEILIRSWTRLAEWLDSSRGDLLLHRHLITAVREWMIAGRDPSYLAAGVRLTELEGLAESDLALNEDEQAYLDASIAERQRQVTEREKQRRRLLRLQQAIIIILVIFLLVAAGLSVFAFSSRTDALSQANIAFARQLAAQAVTELQNPVGNDEFAALLAIRSLNIRYDPIADQALVQASSSLPFEVFSGHTDEIYGVAYSPDGKYVLTGSADHTAKLWDTATGQLVRTFTGHELDVWSVAFSPDGKYILTGSGDDTAKIWDAGTGQVLHTLADDTQVIFAVAYSHDGKYVATGSGDGTGKLWDAATGQEVRTFSCTPQSVEGITFSPDGQYLAAGCGDNTARLWDIATGQEIHRFEGHSGGIYGIAFSPDGKYVLTGSLDNNAILWDVATGQAVRTFRGHTDSIRSVAFSPDGKYILTGSRDYTARLWDVASGDQIRAYRGHLAGIYAIAFSPDGKYLVTAGSDKTAKLWETSSDKTAHIFQGHTNEVYGVAVSPDDRYVLTSSADHTAKLWNAATSDLVRTFSGHDAEIFSVAFSPDGKYVLTGSVDHTAKLWNAATGDLVRTFSGHAAEVWSVAYSHDGKYVLTGSGDHTAKLWNAATGDLVRTFNVTTDIVESVAFSPDGKYILTGSDDNTAKLWDAATGQEIRTFMGHTSTIYDVAYSPDGKYILTGSDDNTAKLWDVTTGQEVRTFSGHTHSVYGVAFSDDGKYILTASADRTARIWDVSTGQSVRTLSGHTDAVWGVAFSHDGKYAVTGSLDYTARLWDTDYRQLVTTTCARLLRDFTDEERSQVPIPDQTATCPK